jgi:hypothetical protein
MERRAFERRSIVAKNDMPFDDQSELQVGASVYDRWSGQRGNGRARTWYSGTADRRAHAQASNEGS